MLKDDDSMAPMVLVAGWQRTPPRGGRFPHSGQVSTPARKGHARPITRMAPVVWLLRLEERVVAFGCLRKKWSRSDRLS
eukprot:363725-Chlamydomonas_euryale.AAC.4